MSPWQILGPTPELCIRCPPSPIIWVGRFLSLGSSEAAVSLISLHASALPAEHLDIFGLALQNVRFGFGGPRMRGLLIVVCTDPGL